MRKLCAGFSLAWLLVAQTAFATSYSDYSGGGYSFTSIAESSLTGDDPAFGSPAGVGSSLQFSPASFTASASGLFGFDEIKSELDLFITATGSSNIEMLAISEAGMASLTGPTGLGGTGAFVAMVGQITILEIGGVAVAPIIVSFNAGAGTNGSLSPGDLGTGLFALPTYPTPTAWSGNVLIDLTGYGAVTKLQLTLNNELTAYSEDVGNGATIQKSSTAITVIPEPGTFALLCGGLLALTLRARGRRA